MAKQHLVRVHGAWCWYKVATLLQRAGHRVTALDLAASGADAARIADVPAFEDYSRPLLDAVRGVPAGEKVVLVGHSLGGLSLALAMETFPEKVAAAVFVSALLPDTLAPPSYAIEKCFNSVTNWMDCQIEPASFLFGPQYMEANVYQLCSPEDSFETDEKPKKERDIEMGHQNPKNKSDYGLENFFDQVKEIEMLMDKMSKILKKLQEANEESKSVTKASAMKEIKARMEKDVDEVGKVARIIKAKLEQMDRNNLENRKKPGCEKGTSVDRSRMSMTIALKKKLKERMNDFQILRQTIQDEYREVVERRVYTVTGARPSEEVIDRLIETGSSEQIFEKAIQGTGRGQVIATVEEIQERHDAVMEIEKRLLELQQIFADMAVLVEAQGEILDNIESQVQNAINHVQSGTDALRTAKSLQKKSRKCMLIAIAILLVIAVIIILSVWKPWAK